NPVQTRVGTPAENGSLARLAEVRHPEQEHQGRDRDHRPEELAGDPANRAGRPIEVLRVEEVQQPVRHRLPLFLAPAGLAVGLALKEVRYGVASDSPLGPRTRWFPRSPRTCEETRQVDVGCAQATGCG